MLFDRERTVTRAAVLICISLLCSCGAKKITNQQVDTDLGNQTVKVTQGSPSEWSFKADTDRCFAIAESKYSEGKAEITLRIASSQMDGQENMRLEDVKAVKALLGQVVLNYKNEGGKWLLEKIESKTLNAKSISVADWQGTFLPAQLSLCDTYDHNKK